ncbi:alkaline phosphatase family protein [Microbacterium sp. 179-I 3D4 NHS]|uniref:alkaline phosphatase family protein n=1 Tax=Microbacterium sp. 179-I 3D4 NHS TaxID=3142381 RepID=UPI0039A0ECEA
MADDLLAAVRGESASLPAVTSAVLVVIDGLGALGLRAHAGHARSLTAGMGKRDTAITVFPSTTAAALTSILTGAWPGEHGLVGYRVLDPARGVLVNQLSGWETDGLDPATWQMSETVFERAAASGHPAFAVGLPVYAHSGFTRATLRGAEFHGAAAAAERVAAAYDLAARAPGSFVYCYLPEVDKAGHKHGIASAEWVAALEDVDAALARPVPAGVGVLVTSDHGMVDVPAERQVILEQDHLDGIRHLGGEPRMVHAYLEEDADADAVMLRWRGDLEGLADVATRDEVVRSGLLGPSVSPTAAARVGDLVAVARGNRAIYDGTAADQRGRAMVGQHGGLTAEERQVPLLRLGALRR